MNTDELDRIVVNASYAGYPVRHVAQDVITRFLAPHGYSLGYAPDTPMVMILFHYLPAREALDRLAALIGIGWRVEHPKRIFIGDPPPVALTAPDVLADMARQLEGA